MRIGIDNTNFRDGSLLITTALVVFFLNLILCFSLIQSFTDSIILAPSKTHVLGQSESSIDYIYIHYQM